MITLPPESKLWEMTSANGTQYMSLKLRDIQLTKKNLNAHTVAHLKAIVKYILKLEPPRLKSDMVELILNTMQY